MGNRPSRPPFPTGGPQPRPDEIAIGRIAGCFGIRGEMKIEPYSDQLERYTGLSSVVAILPDGRRRDLVPSGAHPHKSHILMRFEGVATPNDGELLRGAILAIPAVDRSDLPEDTYYIDELVGMLVVTTSGEEIGPITQVLESPSNDVYVTARGMFPAVKEFVREVDIAQRRVVVEPIEGLFQPAAPRED